MNTIYRICLMYWLAITGLQFFRKDLEMVDAMGSFFYGFWIMFFILMLVFSYVFRKNEKRLERLSMIAGIPCILTGVFMVITLISVLSGLVGYS